MSTTARTSSTSSSRASRTRTSSRPRGRPSLLPSTRARRASLPTTATTSKGLTMPVTHSDELVPEDHEMYSRPPALVFKNEQQPSTDASSEEEQPAPSTEEPTP